MIFENPEFKKDGTRYILTDKVTQSVKSDIGVPVGERSLTHCEKEAVSMRQVNSEGQSEPCKGAPTYLEGTGNNTQVSTWKWHQGAMTNGRMTSLKGIRTQALA